jgi:hypothetical protein
MKKRRGSNVGVLEEMGKEKKRKKKKDDMRKYEERDKS